MATDSIHSKCKQLKTVADDCWWLGLDLVSYCNGNTGKFVNTARKRCMAGVNLSALFPIMLPNPDSTERLVSYW